MKRIMIISALASLIAIGSSAQTAYDAAKLTDRDLNGTARFVGMGGAMGALGGDISTMGTNPAGIGIYRSNDIMTSFGFSAYGTESKYGGNKFNNNNNHWSYDNIGFVFASKIGNQTPLRYVNFGFNYHRAKSFYKNMSMEGILNYTQTDFMAGQANGMSANGVSLLEITENKWNPYSDNGVGWLGALGWDGLLFDYSDKEYIGVLPQDPYANFRSRERGGIDQYDFNVAFNINDRVYLGLTIGAYDVNYTKSYYYSEDYGDKQNYMIGSDNKIDGSGFDFKMGLIVRPFEDSPFRFGVAVHTPTFYKLTYKTNAYLESNVWMHNNDTGQDELINSYFDTYQELGDTDMNREFRLNTPWKYNFNLGYTVGKNLALGAEYEFEDYSTVKFRYPEGDEMEFETNEAKQTLKGVHTLRLGAEYKVIPQFAIRAGYNYISSVFKDDAIKYLPFNSINTDTDFANVKSRSNYTLGIGYRGRLLYADLAYQFSTYKENFYPFYNEFVEEGIVVPNATKVTNTRSQVLFTLGMRF